MTKQLTVPTRPQKPCLGSRAEHGPCQASPHVLSHLPRILGRGSDVPNRLEDQSQLTNRDRFLQEEQLEGGQELAVTYYVERERYDPYEIVVVGDARRKEVSRVELRGPEIKQVPGTFGDPFRVITTMPGVGQMMSLVAYPIVRGTSPGNTAFLLDGVPVFGLPGNPVSSLVSYELMARPALRQMMGHEQLTRPRLLAVADAELHRRPDGKVHFMRVNGAFGPDGRYHVRPVAAQGSHQLAATAGADAMAIVPDGDGLPAGADVEALLLRG